MRETYHLKIEGSENHLRIEQFLREQDLSYGTLITINSGAGISEYHYIIDLTRDELFLISILCGIKGHILLDANNI